MQELLQSRGGTLLAVLFVDIDYCCYIIAEYKVTTGILVIAHILIDTSPHTRCHETAIHR